MIPGLPVGPLELLLVLGILLLILGPGKLPEVGSAVGRTIREFRKASTDLQDATNLSPQSIPPATPRPGAGSTREPETTRRGTPVDPVDEDA
ncbi:hypothetical protein BH18CHL1_BH18CHL1_04790 [soil metagenome]|nr:twin-arginine translocase TatA/TatE family subunit [Chloroflexota bacterium]